MRSQPEPWKCYLTHFPSESADSGKCYYTTAKKQQVCVSDTRNKLLATVWQPPQRCVKFQNQWTTYCTCPTLEDSKHTCFWWIHRALGTKPSWIEELVHAILHTGQVNVIAVDWVYGSTGAYASAVENVPELALSISQFISKLLVSYCALTVRDMMASELHSCKQSRELLPTCCLQELDKQALYSRVSTV